MKLVPAIQYKQQIESYIRSIYYSDESYLMSGFNYSYNEIIEDDKHGTLFQWAILNNSKELMGFVSYNINWYDSVVKNMKLLSFVKGNVCIGYALRDIIKMLNQYELHKMIFYCVDTNPILQKYINFVNNNHGSTIVLKDEFKDRYGKYHDLYRFDILIDNKTLIFDITDHTKENNKNSSSTNIHSKSYQELIGKGLQ